MGMTKTTKAMIPFSVPFGTNQKKAYTIFHIKKCLKIGRGQLFHTLKVSFKHGLMRSILFQLRGTIKSIYIKDTFKYNLQILISNFNSNIKKSISIELTGKYIEFSHEQNTRII